MSLLPRRTRTTPTRATRTKGRHVNATYLRGQPINVVKTFFDINPLTQVGTPGNPDVVTFTTLDPNNVTTDYVFGIDPQVANPQLGVFLLSLPPESPVGAWKWRCAGTGSGIVDAEEGAFDIIESGVLTPDAPTVPVTGPCSAWINGDDVANGGPPLPGIGSDTYLLDDVAYDASYILYEASGRQFPGVCTRYVRPCRQTCACFGFSPSLGLGPWYWTSAWWGGVGTWIWRNECGDSCGCGSESYISLAGYPVREILQVKIDGTVLPQYDPDSGLENWRLDNRRKLLRMDQFTTDPFVVGTLSQWPICQDLALPDTQPGTYSVTYTYGTDVPNLGRQAAIQLARELWKAFNGGKCDLPTRTTRVVRAGVTIDRIVPLADMLRTGTTGLFAIDMFIGVTNPTGMRRRPAVFSPDAQPYAKSVGQTSTGY
jgi:hypothetical protein